MTVLALFLAVVGTNDLVRTSTEETSGRRDAIAVVCATLVSVLGFWGLGRPWGQSWLVVLGVAFVVMWTCAKRFRSVVVEKIALGMFVVIGLIILAFGQHLGASHGWLEDWYSSLDIQSLDGVPFQNFLLAFGTLVMLQSTANRIVRIVLRSAGPAVVASAHTLRGGRIIGPLERTLLFALALGGHYTGVGAVIAAKGILRYPEISRVDDDGGKAEYVLVGSFVSWLLAVILVPLF